MILKGIELFGFKSFAERVRIDLEPGITGIVGPNGSGKSNIVEAIKWVLGEQSAKSLRGQRMEDLIFNGTKKRKPLGMAEISLLLDNSDGYFAMEYTEIRVTRRLYRSGDSEYLLNGKNCRLKDILRLFSDTGIGNDGYAIIGQGRISEILAARPEERRGIIEETAGIVRYRERKREALRKIGQADQNILRIEDIILEIGDRLRPLETEAKMAERYLEAKKEVDELEIGFLAEAVLESRARRGEVEAELAAVVGRGQDLAGSVLQKETGLAEEKGRLLALEGDFEAAQNRHQNQRQHLQKLEGEITTLESRIVGYDEKLDLLAGEIRAFREKGATRESLLQDEEERFAALEAQRAALAEDLAISEAQRLLEEEDLVRAEQTLAKLRAETFEIAREAGQWKNRRLALTQREEGGRQRMAVLDEKTKKMAEEIDLLQRRGGEIAEMSLALREQMGRLRANGDALDEKEAKLKANIASLQEEWNDGRQSRQKAETQLKVLEDLEMKREGFYPGIKAVLAEKSKGRFPGILGVVAEMIQVAPEYATAIETALGSGLQNIIAVSADDVREAIAFLKEEKKGHATFLPLDMLRIPEPLPLEKLKDRPGFIGIGSDLVRGPRQIAPALDFLLRHTIVVDNLEQAIAISRGFKRSARYVTLEGDIIHSGGSISGGSRGQGKTGLLSRKSVISSLRREILTAEEREISLLQRIESLEEDRETLNRERERGLRKIREIEMEVNACQNEEKGISDREAFFNRELEVLALEKGQVEDEIAEGEEEMAASLTRIAELDRAEQELIQRLETMDRDLRAAKEGESESRAVHTEIRLCLTALEKDWENSRDTLLRLREEKDSAAGEITVKERLYGDAAAAREAALQKIAALKGEVLAKGKEIAASDQEILGLGREKEGLRGDILFLEKEIKGLKSKVDENREECHRLELKRERHLADETQQEDKLLEQYQYSLDQAARLIREDLPKREKQQRIAGLKRSIEALGPVNLGAIREYKEVSERHAFLSAQRDDMAEARLALEKLVAQMDGLIVEKFKETFDRINESFQKTFPEFFQGGYGELQLTDEENLLESGVDIVVQPPGKRLQHHGLLSGGEKSLCGIALLFAILRVKPSPFYVLDEIDAALDDINVRRFAAYLQRYAAESQFLVITHRQGTMESAGELYGITMEEEGISKTVSVKLVG